ASGTVFFPWRLDYAAPAANATRGDNVVDNVEQVLVPAALDTPEGLYRLTVSHKGTLAPAGRQAFSLAISGHAPAPVGVVVTSPELARGESDPGLTFRVASAHDATTTWSAASPNAWVTVTPPSGTLQPGEAATATVQLAASF